MERFESGMAADSARMTRPRPIVPCAEKPAQLPGWLDGNFCRKLSWSVRELHGNQFR